MIRHIGFSTAGAAALALAAVLASCEPQASPEREGEAAPEALVFVSDASGTVTVIAHGAEGNEVIAAYPVGSGRVGDMVRTDERHVFVNVSANNAVAAFDATTGDIPTLRNYLPAGTRPVHAYRDPQSAHVWVMNDGDATSGDCAEAGPGDTPTGSVTLIDDHDVGAEDPDDGHAHNAGGAVIVQNGDDGHDAPGDTKLGEVIAEICVGQGHHIAAFSFPSEDQPAAPRRVFVSNITDGTLSVIDNDPDSDDYLTVIATIDLCDPAKQAGGCDAEVTTPNDAVPHGLDYSPASGRIYNANIGYGTVSVIDPETNTIETTVDIGFADKLHATPDGRFVVVKGADTDSDPDHVIGKLTAIDVDANSFEQIDLYDVAPDGFKFTPDGAKLYLTSVHGGSGDQLDNLKDDVLLAVDVSDLPNLELLAEVPVGATEGHHRALAVSEHGGVAGHVFVPASDGTVTVVDIETDEVVDTIDLGGELGSILVVPLGTSR